MDNTFRPDCAHVQLGLTPKGGRSHTRTCDAGRHNGGSKSLPIDDLVTLSTGGGTILRYRDENPGSEVRFRTVRFSDSLRTGNCHALVPASLAASQWGKTSGCLDSKA